LDCDSISHANVGHENLVHDNTFKGRMRLHCNHTNCGIFAKKKACVFQLQQSQSCVCQLPKQRLYVLLFIYVTMALMKLRLYTWVHMLIIFKVKCIFQHISETLVQFSTVNYKTG
jgi:hypothetical protein